MSTLSIKLVYIDVNTCITYSDNVKEVKNMKREEQLKINKMVSKKYEEAIVELVQWRTKNPYMVRLRTCQARVVETHNYYFLQSYNTIVAFIDKRDDTLYDVLRLVYGYTSTSAQHISKFSNDYSRSWVSGSVRYTWREV